MLKHILVFINLYCGKAHFLKKANFLQLCIFKGIGQFNIEIVNIKKISIYKYKFFKKYLYLKNGPGFVYLIYRSTVSTRRNIKQNPIQQRTPINPPIDQQWSSKHN